jgi:hypothetical protein
MQAAHAIDVQAVPTEAQWAQVRGLVFGDAVYTPIPGATET